MRDEVGSFFEEDRNSGQESRWLEELMGRRNVLYTSSGREAIELAILETERLYPNLRKVCLLPHIPAIQLSAHFKSVVGSFTSTR